MTVDEAAVAAYTCPFCRQTSQAGELSCPWCGAPVDMRMARSGGGWVKQPPIRDMARLQFGQSKVQISGSFVPVADFGLAAGDFIYFSHHSLRFFDPSITLTNLPQPGGQTMQLLSGMPRYLMGATGPGHIGLSFDHAGETIAVPLMAGQSVSVREGHFLAATGNVTYDIEDTGVHIAIGRATDSKLFERHYPIGYFFDRFVAHDAPGLLLLHAPADVLIRDLAADETIIIQPRSLIYRDSTIKTTMHREQPSGDFIRWHFWLKLTGPGRIAMASKFVYFPVPGPKIVDAHTTRYSWRNW